MNKIFKSGLSAVAAATFALSCAPAVIAAEKVTFNNGTISSYGNEADFLQISADDKTFTNTLSVENGKEYVVRMFVHNNSGDNGPAAKNAKAVVNGLNGSGKNVTLTGKISADNAQTVSDTASFTADTNITSLTYVDGTAQYYTGFNGGTTYKLGTDLFNNGALLGYSSMNGEIPSCYQYSGWLTFHVKATTESEKDLNPSFTIDKTVQLFTTDDNKTFTGDETVPEAKAGDILRYAIHFKNTGDTDLTEVTIRDYLPKYLEYVKGSTMIKVGSGNDYVAVTDGITDKGLTLYADKDIVLTFKPNSGAWILFKAKVISAIDDECGNKALTNIVQANANYTAKDGSKKEVGTKSDTARVLVKGEVCENPEQPEQPEEPTQPEELPKTGAGSIVASILGAGSLTTAAGYYVASRKSLKRF